MQGMRQTVTSNNAHLEAGLVWGARGQPQEALLEASVGVGRGRRCDADDLPLGNMLRQLGIAGQDAV